MTTPQEKLAASLATLKVLQDKGLQVIPGRALSRIHRERLLRTGFLEEVIKGWYVPKRPDGPQGDSTPWYAGMREFVAGYCNERFGEHWHLNPEQSLLLHSGERTLPQQLQIWALGGANQLLSLPHGCSLFIYRTKALLAAQATNECGGLRLIDLPQALAAVSGTFYANHALAAQVALARISDASAILRRLLAGGHSVIAGRIAGAFRALGRGSLADEIVGAMRAAGYTVLETNPFERSVPQLKLGGRLEGGRLESPYASRLKLLWAEMRNQVIARVPEPTSAPQDIGVLMQDIAARYVADAYHSLSIEGYRVSAALIEKIRDEKWNPDSDAADRNTRDAMAAKGYFETHTLVMHDIERIVRGQNAGAVFRDGLPRWYQALFSPSVQAGILKREDLAGFRNDQVFIRNARHVPLSKEAVRECMPLLFDLLEAEPSAAVRAILGHFVFVYIHPYMDGNGRLARFLMNAMLVSAGHVWTVFPVERRTEYMNALDQASSLSNIRAFADFVAGLMREQSAAPLSRPAG